MQIDLQQPVAMYPHPAMEVFSFRILTSLEAMKNVVAPLIHYKPQGAQAI